jgi:hypothetical protein
MLPTAPTACERLAERFPKSADNCEFTLQLGALRTDFNVQSAALRDEIKSLKGWRNAIT